MGYSDAPESLRSEDLSYIPSHSPPAIDRLQSFVQEVRAASPKSKVIVPKYFEPIALEGAK
jgi:hypothetical protein